MKIVVILLSFLIVTYVHAGRVCYRKSTQEFTRIVKGLKSFESINSKTFMFSRIPCKFSIPPKGSTSESMRAVYQYTGGAYREINYYLRTGKYSTRSHDYGLALVKRMIKLMDLELRTSYQHYREMSYRGSWIPKSVFRKLRVGARFRDKGYLSTSKRLGEARAWASGKILFIILGKSGVDISGIANQEDEEEVLFPRGTSFKIVRIENRKRDHKQQAGMVVYMYEL